MATKFGEIIISKHPLAIKKSTCMAKLRRTPPDLEELKDIVQEYKGEYKLKKSKRKNEN